MGSLTLSACQTYVPAPLSLDTYPAALAARQLDEHPADHAWTGAELVAAALRRNPQVGQAMAVLATARAGAKAAKVRPAMSLTLTAEYAHQASPWLYGAAADVPVDAGVRRNARLSAADLAALQAFYDYGEATWSVRNALARAVADRFAAEQALPLAWTLADARQLRADRLDTRVDAGEDARPLALAARSEAAAARHRLADILARRDQANISLAKALGVSPAAMADLELAPPIEVAQWPPTGIARDRFVAGQLRRDVLRAVADYDLAENALRLEVARQYPEVRLGPGYSWDHGLAKLPFSLSLALPPSDLNHAAIAQAEAKRTEAGRTLETVQAGVLAQIDQTLRAVLAARSQLGLSRDRDLPAAQAAANAAARSLKAGASDRIDDLGARSARLEAEIAVIDAQLTLARAQIDLEDALRIPFDEAQAEVVNADLKHLGATP